MCSYNTLSARTSHKHTRTHKTHHNLNLGEATTFPLIVFFVLGHMRACTQMLFCFKIFEIGTLKTLKAHNFVFRPLIKVKSKAKF